MLYHYASLWVMVPCQNLDRLAGERVPEHLRAGWRWIQTRGRQGTETEAERTAHSTALGFRTPTSTNEPGHSAPSTKRSASMRKATPWIRKPSRQP